MPKFYCAALLLYAAQFVSGQDALTRLIAESTPLRVSEDVDRTNQKNALRDWIESRLPTNITELDASFGNLEARFNSELEQAGVAEPENSEVGTGYISKLELLRTAEFPGALVVRAGVSVHCGTDDSVYVYRFSDTRTRLIEARGTFEWGSDVLETRFSAPDALGNRIFLVVWDGTSCASVWNTIDYRLFRIGPFQEPAAPLFASTHTYVLDEGLEMKVTAQDLLVELRAEAIFPGYRRTHVLHYSIGPESVERIDPVALQPQDFVHEWLIRPWEEMQSRSSKEVAKWHKFLHADLVFGDYDSVQPCIYRPGFTQVGVELRTLGDREIPEPLAVYFLIQDKGIYSYEMSGISFYPQDDCPGDSPPVDYTEMPSLFKKN